MADYPSEYQLDVVLRDGGGARIRPIRADDGDLVKAFFEKLGPESRYYRFFQVKHTLEPAEIEYFTHVDYQGRMALIALQDGEMIAVGRFTSPNWAVPVATTFAVSPLPKPRLIVTSRPLEA